jgi:hypothetical protein
MTARKLVAHLRILATGIAILIGSLANVAIIWVLTR